MKVFRNFLIYNHITELIIISIVLLLFSFSFYVQSQGFHLAFIDTDDYMRVVRTREFFQNYDLCNNTIWRCNVPYGCSLHWTRFYDFFIIIPAFLLSFFFDSINTSTDYVCFFISPIVRIVTAFVFLKMLHKNKILGRDNAFLCLIIFAVQPIITTYGGFGRPDHHAFIVLFVILFLAQYFKASRSGFKKHYIGTARLTTLCLWISPETLIPLLLADGVAFLCALAEKGEGHRRDIFRFIFLKNLETIKYIEFLLIFSYIALFFSYSNLNFITDIIDNGIIEISLAMEFMRDYFRPLRNAVCAEIINPKSENTPAITNLRKLIFLLIYSIALFVLCRFLPIYYDEISIVHWGLYVFSIYFLGMLLTAEKKDITGTFYDVFLVICGALIFLFMFPKFLLGMGADVTPYVKEIWLNRVNEMRSPLENGDALLYILHVLFVFIAVFSTLREIFIKRSVKKSAGKQQKKSVEEGGRGNATIATNRTFAWILLSALSLTYVFFAGFAGRMLLYSSLFSLPLIVNLCMNSKYFSWGNKNVLRIILAVFMSAFYTIVAAAFSKDNLENKNNCSVLKNETNENREGNDTKESEEQSYSKRDFFSELDRISSVPKTIMAHSNSGPALLYYTKHCVVGAPYHRQQEGIISSYEVMEAPYDEKKIKEILKETGSSYIFVEYCNVNKLKKGDKQENNKRKRITKVSLPERTSAGRPSLSKMILEGRIPEWLEKMKMSEAFDKRGALVRVREEAGEQ